MLNEEASELRKAFTGLVRSFGLLRPDTTACGLKMSPSEAHAIVELLDASRLTPSDLAECLHLEKSTITRLVDQLDQRGWVKRLANEDDARSVLIELTAAGTKAARRVVAARQALFSRVLGELLPAERQVVVSSMSRFCEAAAHATK